MNSFGEQVLNFYRELKQPPPVPDGVEVLYPHLQSSTWEAMESFYHRFYGDLHQRVFLIGINPGRLGAGTTGIPFTDPIRLDEVCGIKNAFDQKAELSSKFIYQMIDANGGVGKFYGQFYFTSVSPLGFTLNGKNLNYYDLKELQETWEPYMVSSMQRQLTFGPSHPVAFSLGQGKNHHYLNYINKKYQLFREIRPLPHPRWIMQYRLKRLHEFIGHYTRNLQQVVSSN